LNVTKELQIIFARQKYEKTLHKNLHVNSLWTMLEAYDRYCPTSITATILDSGGGFTDYSSMHKDGGGAAIWK
jgi:hypothetical protein